MEHLLQKVALDSCVVIELMDRPYQAQKLRDKFHGKPICIVLCDVVLREVQKIRGFDPRKVISQITKLLGRKVEIVSIHAEQKILAESVTDKYQICHKGDNLILALCQTKDYVLITFDKMLLRSCEFAGIAAFHPSMAGGI